MTNKTILLIDDEPNLAEVISICLISFKGWNLVVQKSLETRIMS